MGLGFRFYFYEVFYIFIFYDFCSDVYEIDGFFVVLCFGIIGF